MTSSDKKHSLGPLVSRRDLNRFAFFTVGAAALAPSLGNVARAQQASPTVDLGPRGGTLTYARSTDADNLDPVTAFYGPDLEPFYTIFDTLTAVGPDQEVSGVLAESWEISADQKEYTFKLRQGITFHDGTDFNADAVKFHFDRVIDPKNTTADVSWLGPLKAITVVDPYTVKFTLGAPFSPLVGNLASGYFSLPSPTAVQKDGTNFGHNPVGTGAFKFKEWVPGDHITIVPNPDYKNPRPFGINKGAPLLDELVFRVIPQSDTQLAALETGEIDMIVPPNQNVAEMQGNPDYQVLISKGSTGLNYIEFSMEDVPAGQFGATWKAPFDDIRLRQAVAYAIDADSMIEKSLYGLATRNYGPMPTELFAYKPEIEEFGYRYDPDKAKSLLKEAGWTDTNGDGVVEKNGKPLEVLFWSYEDPSTDKVVQIIQNQLGQVGFKVNLQILDGSTMLAQLPDNKSDLNIMGWGQTEPDMLRGMTNGTWGLGRYRDKETQDLLTQALDTTDRAKRTDLYFQASKKMLADCALVPLWSGVTILAARKEVTNLAWGQQDMPIFHDLGIKQ